MNIVSSTDGTALAGLRVLLTRPAGEQTNNLIAEITQLGGVVLAAPSLRITPPEDITPVTAMLEMAGNFDIIIFSSTNAVIGAHALLPTLHHTVRGKLLLAIGKTTQDYLARHHMVSDSVPDPRGGSEALLTHPSLQPSVISDKRVLVVRGQTGRELLRKTLKERGCAKVSYAKVYQQEAETASRPLLHNILATSAADVVVITSRGGLDQLVLMAGSEHWEALRRLPIITLSERIGKAVTDYQFEKPALIAQSSSNQGVIEEILRYNAEC